MSHSHKAFLPYKPRKEEASAEPKKRYTSMSRQRFHEIRNQWISGDLLKKWEDLNGKAKTSAEETEERQIRCIAMVVTNLPELQRKQLVDEKNTQWKEIVFLRDHLGNFYVEVY